MTSRLGGTAALVTGASSGIGEAVAQQLAAEGAAVALVARRVGRLEDLAERITKAGCRALAMQSDVTEEGAVRAAVERATSEFGRLDTVVANAGVLLLGPITGAPTEEWRRMVGLSLIRPTEQQG